MPTHLASFGELLAMPPDELRKEIFEQRVLVRKLRLGVLLNKEKDTAKYRREKHALARMLTAQLSQRRKKAEPLKRKPKTGKVSLPSTSKS